MIGPRSEPAEAEDPDEFHGSHPPQGDVMHQTTSIDAVPSRRDARASEEAEIVRKVSGHPPLMTPQRRMRQRNAVRSAMAQLLEREGDPTGLM